MKQKMTIAIAAMLTFSLVLFGCAAPASAEAAPVGNGYSATRVNAQETGAGNRGGNGNARGGNAGNQYTDGCYTGEPANTTADPDYTLTDAEQTLSLSGYGSAGALEDENMTLADMLTYAIQDEYLARAEYELIISEYGNVRPFTNIMRAEETHIDALLPLFDAYGIAAPKDEGADNAVSVASLTAAYQAGVSAEVNNIAMYELFLEETLPDNVKAVFESLMHASENHLRAFQNQL